MEDHEISNEYEYLNYCQYPPPQYKVLLKRETKQILMQKFGFILHLDNFTDLLEFAKTIDDTGLQMLLHNYKLHHYGKEIQIW